MASAAAHHRRRAIGDTPTTSNRHRTGPAETRGVSAIAAAGSGQMAERREDDPARRSPIPGGIAAARTAPSPRRRPTPRVRRGPRRPRRAHRRRPAGADLRRRRYARPPTSAARRCPGVSPTAAMGSIGGGRPSPMTDDGRSRAPRSSAHRRHGPAPRSSTIASGRREVVPSRRGVSPTAAAGRSRGRRPSSIAVDSGHYGRARIGPCLSTVVRARADPMDRRWTRPGRRRRLGHLRRDTQFGRHPPSVFVRCIWSARRVSTAGSSTTLHNVGGTNVTAIRHQCGRDTTAPARRARCVPTSARPDSTSSASSSPTKASSILRNTAWV